MARHDLPYDPKEELSLRNVVTEDYSRKPEVVQSPVHRSASASILVDQESLDKALSLGAFEPQGGLLSDDVVKPSKSDSQLNLSPPSHDTTTAEGKQSDEEQHAEVAAPPIEGPSEEELAYSVRESQESGHDAQPGAVKGQDSSHDVQAAPPKKRSSKSREGGRRGGGGIRLTQVGIEDGNVAQCSLVTSTGKVVTFKFSLDYDKPSELCRHLVSGRWWRR